MYFSREYLILVVVRTASRNIGTLPLIAFMQRPSTLQLLCITSQSSTWSTQLIPTENVGSPVFALNRVLTHSLRYHLVLGKPCSAISMIYLMRTCSFVSPIQPWHQNEPWHSRQNKNFGKNTGTQIQKKRPIPTRKTPCKNKWCNKLKPHPGNNKHWWISSP